MNDNNSDRIPEDDVESALDLEGGRNGRDDLMPCNTISSNLEEQQQEEKPLACDGFDDKETHCEISETKQTTRQDQPTPEAGATTNSQSMNGGTAVRTPSTTSSSSSADSASGVLSRSLSAVQEQSINQNGTENPLYSNLSMTPTAISQNHNGVINGSDYGSLQEQLDGHSAERVSLSQPAPTSYQLVQGRQSKRRAGGGAVVLGDGEHRQVADTGTGNIASDGNQGGRLSQDSQQQSRPGAYNVSGIASGDIPTWAWTSTNHYYHQERRRRDSSSSNVDDDELNATILESYQALRERQRQENTRRVRQGRIIHLLLASIVAALIIAISFSLTNSSRQRMNDNSEADKGGVDFTGANEEGTSTSAETKDDVPFIYYDDDVIENRWTSIRESIEFFTYDPASLENPLSPQRKALDWLVRDDLAQIDATDIDRLATRYGLAVLYYATNGLQWNDPYQFLSPLHECNWTSASINSSSLPMVDDRPYGISCNAHYRVDSVILGMSSFEAAVHRFRNNVIDHQLTISSF